MSLDIASFSKDYLNRLHAAHKKVDLDRVAEVIDPLMEACKDDKQIFLFWGMGEQQLTLLTSPLI